MYLFKRDLFGDLGLSKGLILIYKSSVSSHYSHMWPFHFLFVPSTCVKYGHSRIDQVETDRVNYWVNIKLLGKLLNQQKMQGLWTFCGHFSKLILYIHLRGIQQGFHPMNTHTKKHVFQWDCSQYTKFWIPKLNLQHN